MEDAKENKSKAEATENKATPNTPVRKDAFIQVPALKFEMTIKQGK